MAQVIKPSHKAKNTPRVKTFKSPIVEFLSRTPVYQPVTLFNVVAAWFLYLSFSYFNLPVLQSIGLFFGGWLFFSLLEYCMHRYVFHMSVHTKTRETVQYNAHGIHHEYPKDKETLAMPLVFSITLGFAFIGVFYLILGAWAFPLVAGIFVGYALYLLMHYLVHAMPPPNNFLKSLWENHAVHHYKDDDVVFGVSSQLWDRIFGTMPKKGKEK